MNEKQQFLKLLKRAKRKLLIRHISNYFIKSVVYIAVMAALLTIVARFFVILYLTEKVIFLGILIILVTGIVTYMKRPTNLEAASLFDQYVQEDRVTTALSFLNDDSAISQLQRIDTLNHMKNRLPKLEKKKMTIQFWKPFLVSAFFIVIATTSLLLPNNVMEKAEKQEQEEKIIEKAKEEIREIDRDDENAEEKLAELEEEIDEVPNSQELLEKLVEEETKLELEKQKALDEQNQIEELTKSLENNQLNELAAALEQSDSEKIHQELEKLLDNEWSSLNEQQKQELESLTAQLTNEEVNLAELSSEELEELTASLADELSAMLENIDSIDQLASLQEQLQEIAADLNNDRNVAGFSDSNQLAFGSEQSTSGENSQGEDSSTGEENPSQGSGDSTGEGQEGSNNSSSSGEGQGSGSGGAGSGIGSGENGGGSGAGAGFGQGSRELTIPEYVDGEERLEDDFAELGDGHGEQQSTTQGPVLKGSVQSYESVYRDYSETYRNGVNRLNLPSYLEDIVKDYFSELNPEGE